MSKKGFSMHRFGHYFVNLVYICPFCPHIALHWFDHIFHKT